MRQKKLTKKEPLEVAASEKGSLDNDNNVFYGNVNDNTNLGINQDYVDDNSKYKQPLEDDVKARHWLFIVYPESAPIDWMQNLERTGIPFVVSDLHDCDTNPDGEIKKPHYHVIVSYTNTTTYRNVKQLKQYTNGPYPLKCESVSSAYAYFTHKNNPDKYQYSGKQIKRFNGWERVLESVEINVIKKELTKKILIDDIREYAELIIATMYMDGDYQYVAMNNTVYFDRLIASYRHAPTRALMRFLQSMEDDDEDKRIIESRLNIINSDV